MKKITNKQAKKYFEMLDEIDNNHFKRCMAVESLMKADLNREDIELAWVNGEVVGIGDIENHPKIIIHRK